MTVEAYLRARVLGYPLEISALEDAALSPIFAKPQALRAIALSDEIEEYATDAEWLNSLKYAASTLYYAVARSASGGSRSEKVGDISNSVSGYSLTASERENFRKMGDALRAECGSEIEGGEWRTESGMFDATTLRRNRWN